MNANVPEAFKKDVLEKLKTLTDGTECVLTGKDKEMKRSAIMLIMGWQDDRANGFKITFDDEYKKFTKEIINQKQQ